MRKFFAVIMLSTTAGFIGTAIKPDIAYAQCTGEILVREVTKADGGKIYFRVYSNAVNYVNNNPGSVLGPSKWVPCHIVTYD